MKFRAHKIEGKQLDDTLYEHAVVAYISMVCWASLPVIVFFGDFQVLEHSVTNAGFLMMTIIYVKSAIKQSRNEYIQLLQSKRSLQDLNKTLKKKVKRRTKKLEQLIEQRKTTFINLAHETKTPLTLINNYLNDYIKEHGDSEKMLTVKRNVNRLTSDIVNFFDVESYEKGFSMYNHDRPSDFSTLLTTKIVLFKSLAEKKHLHINSTLTENVFVKAHPGAIDRIVNNIIENAIKYSGEGSEVQVSLTQNQDWVIFSVKDNGPGISKELHQKVFEPYYKLSIGGRNFEGMGMGLSIVKKITQDLKGEIELISEPGSGTQISVNLPVCFEQDIQGYETTITEDDVNFAHSQILLEESVIDANKPTILIVEDNVEMLNFLIQKLKLKYNILFSTNGAEALKRINAVGSLDLIISDIMMDDMDGYEFCKAIMQVERYAHIPFIFLTAKSTSEDRILGLNAGAVDYIAKPFQIEELALKIESLLRNLKKQRSAVVNQAYHTLLAEPNHIQRTTVTPKRCAFTDNCKKYRITAREVEIIKFLIKGLPYKVIGDQLNISDKTVGKHISNIFMKAGVNNKVELIAKLEAQELFNTAHPTGS